ncbi:MAG: trigger factor [Holosporaceae bacterium]|jgi:trigger factor|nr:trigger factor [Holosporaceae bacterium]
MKILDKTTDGLKRCYNIRLSEAELDAAMNVKLAQTAKKVRLDGFRPGKAPPDVVKRIYGAALESEAEEHAVTVAVGKILKDEKLKISLDYKADILKKEPKALEFSLKFETIPVFELKDISGIEIIRHVAEISPEEVDDFLKDMKKERKKWVEDDSVREIQEGYRATVDLSLIMSGKKPKSREVGDVSVIIGDESYVDDLWKGLLGGKVGEVKEFSINYPADFRDKSLAGQTVRCRALVKKISVPGEYESDDEFAGSVGHKDFEETKKWTESVLKSKYDPLTKDLMRRDLMEQMADLYDFEVPDNMVEIELKSVSRKIKEEAEKLGKEFSPDIMEECVKLTKRRIRLGFVIAEIAAKEKISVSAGEISKAVRNLALSYPGHEKKIIETYSDRAAMQSLAGPILESKVVDLLLSRMKITDHVCSTAELIALDEEPFDFFKDESDGDGKKAEQKTPSRSARPKKSGEEKSTSGKTARKKKVDVPTNGENNG